MTLLLMCLTVTTAWAWDGSGTFNDPYQIKTTGDLNQLASSVNGGTGYEGMYFKLMNDINFNPSTPWNDANSTENNFTSIGGLGNEPGEAKCFKGDFNGNNKTICGIRIYKNGTANADKLRGLFGNTTEQTNIHDLTLADTRITGYFTTGGIVGHNVGTITNCHVANNVAIHCVQSGSFSYGGIAADNDGTISECTSAVTITISGTAGTNYGAIAGENNGTMADNFVNGATIPAASGNSHGAIVGNNYLGTLTCNLYYNCTVAGVSSATGVGSHNADVAADNGAMPGIVLYDNSSINSQILSNVGNVSVPSVTLSGRTLYKDGGWNTLCLPFAVDYFSGTPLEGAIVKTLVSSSLEGTALTLNFTDDQNNLTSIEAGKPYIVKWESGEDITNPAFTDVTISNQTHNIETDAVTFMGCFSPVEIGMEDRTKLYLASNSALHFPNGAMTIGACRAYFQLVVDPSSAPSRIVTNLDAQNTVTALENALPEAERVEESMKLMINGHIYILRDGITYDALGRKVSVTRNL
ncbi:MAG: hypothetical protein E7074_08040 [Bacteroidales bacterium]|nr:hypothetical protein [Bacteroidales bacterium]